MAHKGIQIKTECPTCGKQGERCPARAARHKNHYCNMECVKGEKFSWVGYLLESAKTKRLDYIASHIGVPKATVRTWVYLINPFLPSDKRIRFRKFRKNRDQAIDKPAKIPKQPKVKPPKPPKPPKPKKVAAPKRLEKKKPTRLPDRVIDTSQLKSVRVDRKTVIMVAKNIPDEQAIENYYSKRKSA